MAKRRLDPPSAEAIAKLDKEFRSETRHRPNPASAPIAQVSAEAAQSGASETPEARKNRQDSERLREAEKSGLIISQIPIGEILSDAMIRDRTIIDVDEMTELKLSIAANGLRLPIEVFKDGAAFGLLSGYRRLMAFRELAELNDAPEKYATIKAIVRPSTDAATSFAAMIEENEIRANLSHFERGRIAVIAAQQGAFESVEGAVNFLFASASKSKRSKVKSFAEVFEELGDLLQHAEQLTERRGLRVAGALRSGHSAVLRATLSAGQGGSVDLEWAAMEPAIEAAEQVISAKPKMGRPKAGKPSGWVGDDTLRLSSGVVLQKDRDGQGFLIRISGKPVDGVLIDAAMEELRVLFEKP